MKILKNISLNSIEEYIESIGNKEDNNTLELPKIYSNKDFFEVSSYIQLIATWIRKKKHFTLVIPISKMNSLNEGILSMSDEDLEVIREEVNYAATILSWGNPIRNNENIEIGKKDIRKFTSLIRSEMDSLQTSSRVRQKGNVLYLTCFDHFADTKGLLNSFYFENNRFYDQNEFFFSPFNDRLSYFYQSFNKSVAKDNLHKTFTEITNIIFELMLNTHEWARTNEHFKELSPNIRGVYVKLHKGKIENLRKKYEKSQSLKTFLSNNFSKDGQGLSTFFEISVFDSGPGFIKRNSQSKDLSIKEEVEIVKKCLTLHQTSALGQKSIVKGAGLDRISRILDKKGFLKIRTGRSSLYRDFILTPYTEVVDYNEIQLSDWETSNDQSFTEFSEVEGSTINILYPFQY